jgi:hypothetical protein
MCMLCVSSYHAVTAAEGFGVVFPNLLLDRRAGIQVSWHFNLIAYSLVLPSILIKHPIVHVNRNSKLLDLLNFIALAMCWPDISDSWPKELDGQRMKRNTEPTKTKPIFQTCVLCRLAIFEFPGHIFKMLLRNGSWMHTTYT